MVVELGANDGLRGQPVGQVEANLRAIIDRVKAAGAAPVLLGMRIPTNYGERYARDFAEIYDRIGQDPEVTYVPFFMDGVAGIPELNMPDGIHPTPDGHEKLARNLLTPFRELLRESGKIRRADGE